MELKQACRQIVCDIKQSFQQEENVFKIKSLTLVDEDATDEINTHLQSGLNYTKLEEWSDGILQFIEDYCGTGNINELSALILTSNPVINSTVSAPENRSVENIHKLSTKISPTNVCNNNKFADYSAKYAREKLKCLFIDVCQGKDCEDNASFVNLTIQFINKLIGEIDSTNGQFTVFDMRAPKFLSSNELDSSLLNYTESFRTVKPTISESNHEMTTLICNNYHRLGDPHMWIDDEDCFDVGVLNRLIKLKQEQGFHFDKLYYKPALEALVDQIENDCEFSRVIVQTKFNQNIPVKDYLPSWSKTVREQLLEKNYADFDLDNLEMIVIGSSGVDYPTMRYNSLRALVAESWFTAIPPAIVNFVSYLNKALCLEVQRGLIEKDNPNYDFECRQSMDHVLFINVCHSSNHANEWANSVCSIKLINEILRQLNNSKKLAVLDFRMAMHTHKDDLQNVKTLRALIQNLKNNLNSLEQQIYPNVPSKNTFSAINQKYTELMANLSLLGNSIGQDMTSEMANYYYQNEDCFKIVNQDNYHRYVRFGNPGKNHYFQSDQNYCIAQLRQLFNEGYAIDKLFVP